MRLMEYVIAATKSAEPVPPPEPQHAHDTPEEQLAAEGTPGNTVQANGGGHAAL
jgi:hypothetical protein